MKIVDRSRSDVTSSNRKFFKFKQLKKLTRKRSCRIGKWLVWLFCLTLWMKIIMKMYGGIFSIEIHWNALNKFALRGEPEKIRLLRTSLWNWIERNPTRSSSLFHLQKKRKWPVKSFTIDFYVNVFLSVLIRFFNLKNRWCDEFTWLLSTIFMKDHRGECFGKVSHPYTE